MAKVIIFGVGQIAEIALFYLKNDSEHEVVAFTVDSDFLKTDKFHNLPVISFDQIEKEYPPQDYKMFIPISYNKINKIRAKKFEEARIKGYNFISYISSKATYYNTPVGENCFIFENNVIQPYTKIGDNCILWSGNHIGHHTIIEDHCFLASQIVISGSVTIGEYSFIGVNATIRDNIQIGKSNVIGASSLVLSNSDDNSVFSPRQTDKSKVPSNKLRSI